MASQDPYFEVKSEVESTLVHLTTLLSSASSLSPSEQAYNRSETLGTLISLEADLEELEESVLAVEEEGVARRLGIPRDEVQRRRAFVERVRQVVKDARKQTGSAESPSMEARKRLSAVQGPSGYNAYSRGETDEEAAVEGRNDFEMEQQTLLVAQQDRTLTDIAGTVGLLREQAKVMGQEVVDQNIMLEALEHDVDRTTGRLSKAQRRLQSFIRENQTLISTVLCYVVLPAEDDSSENPKFAARPAMDITQHSKSQQLQAHLDQTKAERN
ncbi:hypothetical protein T439DRAFT_379888 [Meredithblackwellia eburnea MCA 4105]